MVDIFNINDLIYKINAGTKSEHIAVQNESSYKDVLDKIRHIISQNPSVPDEGSEIFLQYKSGSTLPKFPVR